MSMAFSAGRFHHTDSKDSSALVKSKHGKKRSHSSESSVSSQATSDSDHDSFPLSKDVSKTKSPERIELSSDTESSLIVVRKSKKKKKHKHTGITDLEDDVQIAHDGHNGKHHRHRCHHHSHHRHHKIDSSHNSRYKGGRVHRRTCTKHKMPVEVIKIKDEPLDEPNERTRQSHSSHRRLERKTRAKSEDSHNDQLVRRERHPETSTASRSRNHLRRENTYHRKEGHGNRSEHTVSYERQTEEKSRTEERENRGNRSSRNGGRGVPEGRRNRWGNEGENSFATSRPIKQEPNSEGEEEGEFEWGKKIDPSKEDKKPVAGQKEKPNFGLSGKLAEDTNTFNGVVIKYSEPPEARKPKRRWRFYPFKGDKGLPTLYIHRQSSYLIGRDRKIADIPVDHPSCSKQHAALQYRLVPFERNDGTKGKRVRPYIIDLESSNGTFVNNVKIEPKTYVELLEKDVIKFGYSSREYVLLHEQSKDEELDDDVAGGND